MEIEYVKSIDKYVLRDNGNDLWSTERWVLEEEMKRREKQNTQLNIFDIEGGE